MRDEMINFLTKVSMADNNIRTKEEWNEHYDKMMDDKLEALVMCYGGSFENMREVD